jgi:hypothetical protein
MRDLKDLGVLLLGFIPWLLFLFLSGHTLVSLEHAILISLAAAIIFGIGDLKRGYILSWGTLIFFSLSAILVNLLKVIWVAEYMDLLANTTLTAVMWLTIAIGKPFALQYAQRDLPKEAFNDPKVVKGCLYITLVWAYLMTFSALVTISRRCLPLHLPNWVYFDTTLCVLTIGLIFTTLFKRQKRLQRDKAGS